jgi:hypothetical protein
MAEWDYHLEEQTARVAADIRGRQRQLQEAIREFGPVPIFVHHAGQIVTEPLREILEVWESDPDNAAEDEAFIRQLRRTDLPVGSFFVLNWGAGMKVYHWMLCEPETVAASE